MLKHVIVLIFLLLFINYSDGQICVNNQYNVRQQTKTSSCIIWADYHLKTFDDHGISFKSSCSFTLTTFRIGTSLFTVEVGKTTNLYTYIQITHGTASYKLALDDKQKPVFSTGSTSYSVPHSLPGINVHKPGNRIFVDFTEIGVSIRWDIKNMVEITIDNSKGYKVLGLCGNNDKCSSNDLILKNNQQASNLQIFLQEWQTNKGTCSSGIKTQSPCDTTASTARAEIACALLRDRNKFGQANEILNPELYIRACVWNYCSCKFSHPTSCLCEVLDVYARASVSAGVDRVSWRDEQTCPVHCTGELRFQSCAPKGGVRTCGDSGPSPTTGKCEEGCYCLANNFLLNGKCYLKKNCPCLFQGRLIQPGETVPNDCNTCTCTNGKLECTDNPCAVGSCTGDPHYTTFDGKKYDFMGRCAYYLVKGTGFSIEADQYGYLNGHFLKNYTQGPSYARGVFVRMDNQVVELKPDLVTLANGIRITRFPHQAGLLLITKPSESYVMVYLPNNIQVIWNGVWSITVKVPQSMEGKIMGLLGTLTGDQSDDFMMPDGEIVTNPTTFGNSWKTEYSCRSEPLTPIQHPCNANPDSRPAAEKACSLIKSDIFKNCRATDAEVDYQNCVYDACYYPHDMPKSYCSSISIFADECGKKGIAVNWRERLPECRVPCPAGLEYQTCSNGCTRSCEDIAHRPNCAKVCIEGCNCPAGKTLNEDGICIRIEECKCRIGAVIFPPDFKYIYSQEELRTCRNAKWIATVPNEEELRDASSLLTLNARCAAIKNSVYTPCKYAKTCQNMDNYKIRSITVCEEGCQCIDGYILDTTTNRCVKPEDCPCYDKGKVHSEGSIVETGLCSKCTCENGKWQCSDEDCFISICHEENKVIVQGSGKCVCKKGVWRCIRPQCDVWDGFHIKTFHGIHYDFHGECSYILAQGKFNTNQFRVTLSNQACWHGQATCFKSLTITTNVKEVEESITLVQDGILPNTNNKKSLLLTDYVQFVTVDIFGTGIQVFWNKKTWVYVQVDSKWLNSVKGLCGIFNGLRDDSVYVPDLPLIAGRIFEYFGIWKSTCDIKEYRDACDIRSIVWAKQQCMILWSDVFAQCRARIRVDEYYQTCVRSACKCQRMANCKRACSAIAIYAQQCNNYGIFVNWRTQNTCPIECSRSTEHQYCVPLCSPVTCELVRKNITPQCLDSTCVEGCAPKPLPLGYAYSDSKYENVVPFAACLAVL